MFFILKRTLWGSLAGLVILATLGFVLRHFLPTGPPLELSVQVALMGVGGFVAILGSDAMLHGLFWLIFGSSYQRLLDEFAQVFDGQGFAAMVMGGLMAAGGEELVFRGLSAEPGVLALLAVGFGAAHFIRPSLTGIAVWAVYEGLLLAGVLLVTGSLFACMVAHFLHDVAGFLLLQRLRRLRKTTPFLGS